MGAGSAVSSLIAGSFSGNNAANGGAVYINGVLRDSTFNASFTDNTAVSTGGAIHLQAYGHNSTISGVFMDNNAQKGNSIFFNHGTSYGVPSSINVNITNSIFSGKNSIYVNPTPKQYSLSLYLINNTELENGGEYFIYNNVNLYLSDNDLANVIYNNANVTSTTNVTFLDNSTKSIYSNPAYIYANIYDDNHNRIVFDIFTFTINDDELKVFFDKKGTASAYYQLNDYGNYTINSTYVNGLLNNTGYYYAVLIYAAQETTDIIIDTADVRNIRFIMKEDVNDVLKIIVNFETYDVDVVNGTGNLTLNNILRDEDYYITAIFEGNDKYFMAVNFTEFYVPKEDTPMKVNDIAVNADEDIIVNVTNLPLELSGENIIINIGIHSKNASIDDNGIASVTFNALAAGEYEIIASYSGDDDYKANATHAALSVNKISPEIHVDAPEEASAGDNVTVGVSLAGDATGIVLFNVNDVKYYAPVEEGNATLTLLIMESGNYTVECIYLGDEKYKSANATAVIHVTGGLEVIAEDLVKYFHGPERFNVKVLLNGKGAFNKTVNITLNGISYNKLTDENGEASFAVNLNSGNYTAAVEVENISVSASITVKLTVEGSDLIKVYGNASQYFATFYDSSGNILANKTATFNINGVFYNRTTDENGVAKLNINLNQGKYVITSFNTVTGENTANNITVLSRITENRDITKYYRNSTQYTVKLIGDDGNAVGKGETVTFNINGVFYNRTTDDGGVAQLNINLQPGKYIITAEYMGCKESNNITVLPVLNASDLTKKYGEPDQFVASLVDGRGAPYAGENITFNINGVFYNRTTDAEGHAGLNINLMPEEYIITSSYAESNIANTIKVTV